MAERPSWHVIRTSSGRLLSFGDSGAPVLFPSRKVAEQWCMPGEVPEPTEFRPAPRDLHGRLVGYAGGVVPLGLE